VPVVVDPVLAVLVVLDPVPAALVVLDPGRVVLDPVIVVVVSTQC
jgi:hypothetical protein